MCGLREQVTTNARIASSDPHKGDHAEFGCTTADPVQHDAP